MTKLVEDIDRGWKRIMREMSLQARSDLVVDVGIIGAEAEESHAGSQLTNADVGLFHEHGTRGQSLGRSGAEAGGTPERSFLRATVDEKHAQISRLFIRIVRGVFDGKLVLRFGLNLVGEKVVSWVKTRIRKGIPPPLMPSTIASKGSSKPLIDKGQLIGSLTYAARGPEEGAR